ncbi:hypothetical protein D9M71_554740 [compost metagenome]
MLHGVALVVDDDHLGTRGDASGGADLAVGGVQVVGLAEDGHGVQALGGAVDLHEDVAEALLGLAQLGRAHGRRAVGQGLQRREVVVAGLRQFQQPVDHGRHQQGHADPFGGDVAA